MLVWCEAVSEKTRSLVVVLLVVSLLLGAGLAVTIRDSSAKDSEIERLKNEVNDLRSVHVNLQREHDGLRSNFTSLQLQYGGLMTDFLGQKEAFQSQKNLSDTLVKRHQDLMSNFTPLQASFTELNTSFARLNASLTELLKSNRLLGDKLTALLGKYVLLNESSAQGRRPLEYSPLMLEYVNNITLGDTSEADLGVNLRKIHDEWERTFVYTYSKVPFMRDLVNGSIQEGVLPEGIIYFRDANLSVARELDLSAISYFHAKTGTCIENARVLAALYYAYLDEANLPLSVYCLMISPNNNLPHGHACVLIRRSDGNAAIIDWTIITTSHKEAAFVTLGEARAMHEKYWGGFPLTYCGVQFRDRVTGKLVRIDFRSNSDFDSWFSSADATYR